MTCKQVGVNVLNNFFLSLCGPLALALAFSCVRTFVRLLCSRFHCSSAREFISSEFMHA